MKNIHVLPTDKPSNITIRTKTNELMYSYKLFSCKNGKDINVNQNIYITYDEEIKDGDYYLYLKYNSVQQFIKKHHTKLLALDIQKKIILTTDQDLIDDGVQAIDDEFLEWFVKNPSCEEVAVIKTAKIRPFGSLYITTIPKEETKQVWDINTCRYWDMETGCEREKCICKNQEPKQDLYCPKCQSYVSSESVTFEETHQICNTSVIIQEPKQETLEEVIPMTELVVFLDKIKKNLTNKTEVLTIQLIIDTIKNEFIDKEIKWRQEQNKKISIEDLEEVFYKGWILSGAGVSYRDAKKRIIEQFKNQ